MQAVLSERAAEGGAADAGVGYLLCIPFGGKGGAAAAAEADQQQRRHVAQGAITLGFPACPEISARWVQGAVRLGLPARPEISARRRWSCC